MEAAAKLITAVAALVAALSWPVLLVVLGVLFRREMRSAAGHLPTLLGRVTKMKIAGIEAELERVADAALDKDAGKGGAVTADQTRSAALIEVKAKDIGLTPLLTELDKLCLEYDSVRRAMAPGRERTQTMTRILVKMRSLAPSIAEHVEAYKISGSAGSRLAAIAVMQMVPKTVDLLWLSKRFSVEQPFVFYHAALALQNAINHAPQQAEKQVKRIAKEALETVSAFEGVPDDSTIMVLQNIIDY